MAELPEDKSSDYKANQGQRAKMPGERRNQPLRGRSQAEGRPLAAVSDPARGGFASTGYHPPLKTGWPLRCSLSSRQGSNSQASTGPARLSMPSQRPPALRGNTFPTRRTGWLAGFGHHIPSNAKSPGRGLSPVGSQGLQAGSGALGLHRALL